MEKINIYELLYQIHMDDEYAIVLLEEQFKPSLVSWVNERLRSNFRGSRLYFDDLYQEALMGLYEACEIYREDKQAAFTTFAKIIVENKLKNYTRELLKKSDVPLDLVISLDDMYIKDGEQVSLNIISTDTMSFPEYRLQMLESKDDVEQVVKTMSIAERDVFFVWHEGIDNEEGARLLNITKRIYGYNLYRAKKKIRKHFNLQKDKKGKLLS